MAFKVKRVHYEDTAVDSKELVTISQAAEILSMSKQGVISALDRGSLTEIVDETALKYRKGRRLLIKSEVFDLRIQRSQ